MGYTVVMGLHVKQNQKRSQLQERLDEDLRAKMEANRNKDLATTPDGVDDSAYIKGTKQTSSIAWMWLATIVAAIVLFGFFIYRANTV